MKITALSKLDLGVNDRRSTCKIKTKKSAGEILVCMVNWYSRFCSSKHDRVPNKIFEKHLLKTSLLYAL